MRTLAGLFVVLAAFAPLARADVGTSAGGTLERPLGARAPGLGQAFVSVDGGIDSLGYNPAGLSTATHPALQTTYTRGIVDDYFSYAGYVHPIGPAVLAAGALYYDAGNIHITLSDGTDRVVKAQQDYVEMLGAGLNLGGGLSIGALLKVYQFHLGQQASAQGYAADGGVLYHTPVTGLNLGASVQNMGPSVKFEAAADALPTTYRAGASYLLDLERLGYMSSDIPQFFMRYLFTADAVFVRQEPSSGGAGVEMDMPFGKFSHALLRAGYVLNRDLDGLTIGVGFRERHFIVDYAVGIEKTLGDVHRFSIGYEF